MKDRVSLYPGRVKLTPVSGQENTYDMVRADEPAQEGTPLNKATLLKDPTAALLGLDENAVPDDAFVEIYSQLSKRSQAVLLWKNASPGSNFASQTISVPNMNKYSFVYVKYSSDLNQSEYVWGNIADCKHTCIVTAHMHSRTYRSAFTQPQGNTVTFFDCQNISNTNANYNMIPIAVYGINVITV